MLTEYEVRRHMEDVQNSSESPLQKVRKLLKLGRVMRRRSQDLRKELSLMTRSRDRNGLAGLRRLESQATRLQEDLRREAFKSLSSLRRK